MNQIKTWAARHLRAAAQRLDPQPTVVTNRAGGGWLVEFNGVPLAQINPGQVNTTRK